MGFLECNRYTTTSCTYVEDIYHLDIYHLVIYHLDIYSLDEFGGFGTGNEGGRGDEQVEAAP